jgi:hypothetical protein
MRGDLPFQPVDDLVERGIDVVPGAFGSKDPAAPLTGDLHAMAALDPRGGLLDDLHLDPPDPRIEPFELGELVLGGAPELFRDSDAPALQDEVHSRLALPSAGHARPGSRLQPG